MLKDLASKIWQNTPRLLRIKIIRASQKKFTASVGAIILNEKDEVLLLDHVFRPTNGWGIPGGFIEPNEQVETAIKREIYEETGLELIEIKMLKIRTIGQHIEILFKAKAKGTASVKSQEIKEVGWFAVNQMPELMSETQKQIVRQVFDS